MGMIKFFKIENDAKGIPLEKEVDILNFNPKYIKRLIELGIMEDLHRLEKSLPINFPFKINIVHEKVIINYICIYVGKLKLGGFFIHDDKNSKNVYSLTISIQTFIDSLNYIRHHRQ